MCDGCCVGFSRGGSLHVIESAIGFMWQNLAVRGCRKLTMGCLKFWLNLPVAIGVLLLGWL